MIPTLLPELREEIFSYCSLNDLKNLRYTSSQWSCLMQEYIFHTVRVPVDSLHKKLILNDDISSKLKAMHTLKICNFHTASEKEVKIISANYQKILKICTPSKLNLFGSYVPEKIFRMIADLKGLLELDLYQSNVTDRDLGVLFGGLKELRVLNLGWTNITDAGLVNIKNMKFLENLGLASCKFITDNAVLDLSTNQSLQKLNFGYCKITPASVNFICKMKNLKELSIAGCLSANFPPDCKAENLSSLRKLSVANNQNIKTEEFLLIRKLSALKELKLNDCRNISDDSIHHIKDLPLIEKLNLSGCDITDQGMFHVGSMSKLRALDISACVRITNSGISHLLHLPFLEDLSLNNSKVTNDVFSLLGNITTLRQLDLSYCYYLSNEAVPSIRALSRLVKLNIRGCHNIDETRLTEI